jgi:hypothetical protein
MGGSAQAIWRRVGIDLLCVLVVVGVAPRSAEAVLIRAWTFQELASVSDVVLVAEHLQARDTGRRSPWYRTSPLIDAAEWESELKVLLQLKADAQGALPVGSRVRLRYYRIEEASRFVIGMPAQIDFTADKGPYYLVFLRRVSSDVFEPASRHNTPVDSVFSLQHVGGLPIQWEQRLPTEPPPPAPRGK